MVPKQGEVCCYVMMMMGIDSNGWSLCFCAELISVKDSQLAGLETNLAKRDLRGGASRVTTVLGLLSQ